MIFRMSRMCDFEVNLLLIFAYETNQGVTLLVFPARITAGKRSFPTWGIYLQYSNFAFFFQQRSTQKTQWFIPFWKQKTIQKNFQSAHIKACESQSFAKHRDHQNIGQHCRVRTWPLRKIDHNFIFSAPSPRSIQINQPPIQPRFYHAFITQLVPTMWGNKFQVLCRYQGL